MLPLLGSIHTLGAIIWFEVSAVMTLDTTSFSVRPISLARVRSMFDAKRRVVEILRHEDVGDAP